MSNDYGLPAELTEQAIFDKVAVHLLRQGRPSMLPDGFETCAYRGESGTACAIGCLISDDRYTKWLEGKNANAVINLNSSRYDFSDMSPFYTLLDRLQKAHDAWGTTRPIRPALLKIAEKFDLSTAVLGVTPAYTAEGIQPALPEELTRFLAPETTEA